MAALAWLPGLAPIVAKAVATALVVGLASVLAEAIGPFWGALIASLPVSAGPAYVFLAMQHDAGFVAASALNSFAANAATGAFLIVYALKAGRSSLWRGLSAALATWLVASLIIQHVTWTPGTATLLNLIVYSAGFLILRRPPAAAPALRTERRKHWYDLPIRAAAIAIFVSAVVLASSVLGPRATGIAAVFPISLTSVIVIVRPRIGGDASALLALTALRAMLGFGAALLVLHLAMRPLGTVPALLLALSASLAWSAGLLVLNAHRPAAGRTARHPDV